MTPNITDMIFNRNDSTQVLRIWVHMGYFCFYCFFLILPGIFGCGGDGDPSTVDEDPSEKIVGTWKQLTIDGKTPTERFQEILADEVFEVHKADVKLVFAPDDSLYGEVSLLFEVLVPKELTEFILVFRFKINYTTKGSYVISGSTIEMILGELENFRADDFQWHTVDQKVQGNPAALEEFKQGFEQGFLHGFQQEVKKLAENRGLELKTNTFDFEGDILTLMNGITRIYQKK